MKYYIGVDLGGTKIAAGIVDETYHILASEKIPTNLPRPQELVEEDIAGLCMAVAKKAGVAFQDVQWVGIGTPGSVSTEAGIVYFGANFGYFDWTLKKNMERRLGCRIYIENDANAAAYGEYMAGALKDTQYSIAVTLGTGIGSGIIIHGKLFSGFNSSGAELGHMVIVKDGRQCKCGRLGCYEQYASARALTLDTADAMRAHPENMMWGLVNGDITRVNAKTAFDGMRAGDKLAKEIVDRFENYVACGLTNIINIFQPEIICIGGGISREGDTLLDPIRAHVDAEDYARTNNRRTKIVCASLMNDAGIVGAALLGMQFING